MTYQELIDQILQLEEEGLEIFNVGQSVLGKNILATHVGDYSGTQIIIQAGIHAREYITSLLLVEQARYLHNNQLVNSGGIYFVFLTNPDGAQISLDGIESLNCNITKQYLTYPFPSSMLSEPLRCTSPDTETSKKRVKRFTLNKLIEILALFYHISDFIASTVFSFLRIL